MKPVMSIETRRKLSAAMLGRVISENTKKKMASGATKKKFPPKCNKCSSRDAEMCARYNMTCSDAREKECFRKHMKRKVHEDYIKKVTHAV
jgi:hypothetical protein